MNAEFAKRLMDAPQIPDKTALMESQIEEMAGTISRDTIAYQGRARYKNHHTAAAMLAYNSELRVLLPNSDVQVFDRIVADVRTLWLTLQNRTPNGKKVIQRTTDGEPVF